MTVRVREEKWEDPPQPTFKEVLAKPAPKPVLPMRMEDIGERYGDCEWEQRKQRLLSCDESQKIGFVDSHLHLYQDCGSTHLETVLSWISMTSSLHFL